LVLLIKKRKIQFSKSLINDVLVMLFDFQELVIVPGDSIMKLLVLSFEVEDLLLIQFTFLGHVLEVVKYSAIMLHEAVVLGSEPIYDTLLKFTLLFTDTE